MPARVLICDDSLGFGVLFTRWLRDGGIREVERARTAGEAVMRAREHQPHVIVVDHLLPDGTSERTVPQLRAAAPGAQVVLVSGMPPDELEMVAQAVGADSHVAKAATAEEMRAAIIGLLQMPTAA